MISKKIKSHLALLVVSILYGALYSIAKEVMQDKYIGPNGLILIRIFGATILLALVDFIFIREKIEWKDYRLIAFTGFVGVTGNQLLFFTGIKYTSPINASLLMITVPIIVLLVSAIILNETISFRKIIGLIIGILGAFILILGKNKISLSISGIKGDILVLLNAILYGFYLVIIKPLMIKYNPISVISRVFIFGSIYIIPFGWNEIASTNFNLFNSGIWIAILYIIIGVTFLTYLLNAYALKYVAASTVSIYLYLQPIIATIIAIWLGQDSLNLIKVIAAVLIFSGVYLVSFSQKNIQKLK